MSSSESDRYSQLLAPPQDGPLHAFAEPRFSVLIATYQAADTICDAVESALRQTRPPLEVIVCDDGSTDDTESALGPYRDRIMFIRKDNGGAASALNAAARIASGDFVVVLDADDAYLPERLEALAKAASARPDLDALATDAYVEVEGQILRRAYTTEWRFEPEAQRAAILRRNFIFNHCAIKRARVAEIGGWDESLRIAYDWDFWVRLLLAGGRIGLVPEPLSRYRVRRDSLSAQRHALVREGLTVLEKAARDPRLSEDELNIVHASQRSLRRHLLRLELVQSLVEGRPDARRRAVDVIRDPTFGARTRAKAAAAAAAPRIVGSIVRRSTRGSWTGPGATRVKTGGD